jgi:hypothetical protein
MDIKFGEIKNNKVDVTFSVGDAPVIIEIDCEIYSSKKSKQMGDSKGEIAEFNVKVGQVVCELVEYGDDLMDLLEEKFKPLVDGEGKAQEVASQVLDDIIDWAGKQEIAFFSDCQDSHDYYELF